MKCAFCENESVIILSGLIPVCNTHREYYESKDKCCVCGEKATKVCTPMIQIMPEEPQGYLDYIFWDGWDNCSFAVCDKHKFAYQCADIGAYNESVRYVEKNKKT